MKLSKSYLKNTVGLFAMIYVVNFAFVNHTNAQSQGFKQKNTSLANQFETAISSKDIDAIGTIGFELAHHYSAKRQFDSTTYIYNTIAQKAKALNADSLHYSAKHAQSYIYLFTKQYEKSELISRYILAEGQKNNVPKQYIASAYYMLGYIENTQKKYNESNKNLYKGLELFEAIKDTLGMGECLRSLSMNAEGMHESGKAISFLVKAIEYLEEMDSYLIINMYHNIINMFLDQKNVYKAKEYISLIENYKDKIPSEFQNYKYKLLKARILKHDKNYTESNKLMASSLKYFTEKNIARFKHICFLHLANDYLRNDQLKKCEQLTDSLQQYFKYIKTNKQEFSYYLTQGRLAHKQGFISKAEVYLDSAKHSIHAFKDIRKMQKYHNAIYEVHKEKGNLNLALSHLEKFKILNDSIYKMDQNMLVNVVEAKYFKSQQDKKINNLNQEKELSIQQLNKQRRSLKFSILGLIILGLIAFYIFKLNNKLKSKNTDLKLAHNEKDFLLREIHHRVKNNLQVISSLLALQSKYIKDDNALSAIKQGQDRVYSMALIHQDLYQSNNLKGVNSKEYFEHLIDNLFDSYNINEEQIELNYDVDSIVLDVDTMIPLGLVMNELVSNALKHAFKAQTFGKIDIDLKRSEDYLTLKVSDNGKGLKNIKDLEGESFGYELIKAFARKLKAEINIESSNGLSIELKIKNYKTAA